MSKPLVVSYLRFSTKKQEHGSSIARQTHAALRWCQAKGLELSDMCFHDLGRSAYTGENVKRGALKKLLDMCQTGEIPAGSYLLFESFDRMTRLSVSEATSIFSALLETGVVVVTLNNGREWKRKHLKQIDSYLVSVLDLFRANSESARKSELLRGAFKVARANGVKWKFSSLPGWIQKKDGLKDGSFEIIPSLAESVVKVFEHAARGYRSRDICLIAQREGWPIPSRLKQTDTWTPHIPRRLLLNRAVLGEHTHKQYYRELLDEDGDTEVEYLPRGQSTGLTISDYYPRIISDELWAASRGAIKALDAAPKRDFSKFNFFSGLLFCGFCGATMTRRSDLRRSDRTETKGNLMCTQRKHGHTSCPSQGFRKFDVPVLLAISNYFQVNFGSSVSESNAVSNVAALEALLLDKSNQLTNMLSAIALSNNNSDFVAAGLRLSSEKRELELQLEAARLNLSASPVKSIDDIDTLTDSVIPHLYSFSPDSIHVRSQLFLTLTRLIDSIYVYPYDVALVLLKDLTRIVVPLPYKSHVPKPQPKLALALSGLLEPPAKRLPAYQSFRFR